MHPIRPSNLLNIAPKPPSDEKYHQWQSIGRLYLLKGEEIVYPTWVSPDREKIYEGPWSEKEKAPNGYGTQIHSKGDKAVHYTGMRKNGSREGVFEIVVKVYENGSFQEKERYTAIYKGNIAQNGFQEPSLTPQSSAHLNTNSTNSCFLPPSQYCSWKKTGFAWTSPTKTKGYIGGWDEGQNVPNGYGVEIHLRENLEIHCWGNRNYGLREGECFFQMYENTINENGNKLCILIRSYIGNYKKGFLQGNFVKAPNIHFHPNQTTNSLASLFIAESQPPFHHNTPVQEEKRTNDPEYSTI